MRKGLLRPVLFLATGIVVIVASFVAFPGLVPIAHASTHVKCDPGPEYDNFLLSGQYFVPTWQGSDINSGLPPITRTYQVTTTNQVSAQVSAQLQGNTNFVFEQAQVTLGVQVSGSQTIQQGETTQYTLPTNTVIHVYRGVTVDQITVYLDNIGDNCEIVNQSLKAFEAPEAPQWRMCLNPYINGQEVESAGCQAMQNQLNRNTDFPASPVQISG